MVISGNCQRPCFSKLYIYKKLSDIKDNKEDAVVFASFNSESFDLQIRSLLGGFKNVQHEMEQGDEDPTKERRSENCPHT